MYGLEYFNFKNYNLIVDSSYNSPEEIAHLIMEEAEKFYDLVKDLGFKETNKGWNSNLVSPRLLLHEEITEDDKVRLKTLAAEIKENGKGICKKILVKKVNEEYHIIEGKDEVMASILAEIPFVEIILTK